MTYRDGRTESYGPLGVNTRVRWKELLASGTGLFAPVPGTPANIIGPRLTPEGDVVGDQLAMETAYFAMNASPGQVDFHTALENDNPIAAREYVLFITGAIGRWRSDVKLLRKVLSYLRHNEEMLEDERTDNGNGTAAVTRLADALHRHFPGMFKGFSPGTVRTEGEGMAYVRDRVRFEEHYLRAWLRDTRDRMPFLFD